MIAFGFLRVSHKDALSALRFQFDMTFMRFMDIDDASKDM